MAMAIFTLAYIHAFVCTYRPGRASAPPAYIHTRMHPNTYVWMVKCAHADVHTDMCMYRYMHAHTHCSYGHAHALAAFADPGADPRAPPAEIRRSLRSMAINVPSTASNNNNNNKNNNTRKHQQ